MDGLRGLGREFLAKAQEGRESVMPSPLEGEGCLGSKSQGPSSLREGEGGGKKL